MSRLNPTATDAQMLALAGSGVTVWRPHSKNRTMPDSRNAYGGDRCGLPSCPPIPANPKNLKVCSGCHIIKYCSPAHQKEHWKEHKPWCKSLQESQAQCAALDTLTPPGRPTQSELNRLIEDFNTAHDWTITRAIASAVHAAGPDGFNCRNHLVEINVTWRAESNGNPATMFGITSAYTRPDPQGFSTDVMRVSCNGEDDHYRATMPHEYVCYVLVRYIVDDLIPWQTGYPILKQDLPQKLESGTSYKDWVESLRRHVDHGIVYRRGQSKIDLMAWTPGILEKKGKNWVWKARASDIPVVPVSANVK